MNHRDIGANRIRGDLAAVGIRFRPWMGFVGTIYAASALPAVNNYLSMMPLGAGDLLAKAKQVVANALAKHPLRIPDTSHPVIRVGFRDNPSWSSLALLQAFAFDASFVFNQEFEVTDAYYGCFEVDFIPSDTTPAALSLIKNKIDFPSDLDALLSKYKIFSITLYNWAFYPSDQPRYKHVPDGYTMCFDA